MFRNLVLMAVLCAIALPGDAWPVEPVKSPYQIRFGTLEINDDLRRRYVFRWSSEEVAYDTSVKSFLSGGGNIPPGLPDLTEIGFRTQSGKILKYNKLARDLFLEQFFRKNPGEKVDALIFSGLLEDDLEIKVKGKTPVCRVDINLNGDKTTLWKNLPAQPTDASSTKSEK